MTREEMVETIVKISDPLKEKEKIYAVLDELGIKYRKSNCGKCARDLMNIAREELGLIANAADESDFNGGCEYEYLKPIQYQWRGHRLNQNTPKEVIEVFLRESIHGGDYFRRIEPQETEEENNENQHTE